MRRAPLAVLGFLLASAAWARPLLERTGELGPGAETLRTGEFAVSYTVALPAGQYVEARLQGEGFDPYLVAILPTGAKLDNNDFAGRDSQVSFLSGDGGGLKLIVTSVKPGERGSYRLVVEAGSTDGPLTTVLDRDGALSPADDTLRGGEYQQNLRVRVKAGQILRARLESEAFEPYLAMGIDGRGAIENHSFDGRAAEIACRVPADGLVRLVITSRAPGQTGAFHLAIQTDGNGPILMNAPGALTAGSPKLPGGEPCAVHRVAVTAGQRLRIRLEPAGFEGYLLVIPPGAKQYDVRANGPGPVETVVSCPAAGELQLVVTILRPGEQGEYTLDVRPADAMPPAAAATPLPEPQPTAEPGDGGPVPLASIGAGSPEFNPRDPRLRKPAPQPRAAAVQDPGILAETLHRRNSVMIIVQGVHQWQDQQYEYDAKGGKREEDKSGERYEKIELYSHHFQHLKNAGGAGDLQWTGNIFTAHWAVEVQEQHWWNQPYAYTSHDIRMIDITGTVDPSGDRIERIDLDYYQSWKTIDRQDNKHEYKAQQVSRIVLTDLPFNAAAWLYPERPEPPHSLSGAVARLRQKRTGNLNLDFERLFYEVTGPDARDHLLSFTHRTWEPGFGAPSMFGGNLHTREWKNTQWLSQDPSPTIQVVFYNYVE